MEAFSARVLGSAEKVRGVYEDDLGLALAMSLMPMEEMEAGSAGDVVLSRELGEVPAVSLEEALTRRLVAWFKGSFFEWVDAPACETCGSAGTRLRGVAAPTPEERARLASRTEVYWCPHCRGLTRFPRLNSPAALLETRRGRCGEWASAFLLCARAAGLDVREVSDWSDHVWCEVWWPETRGKPSGAGDLERGRGGERLPSEDEGGGGGGSRMADPATSPRAGRWTHVDPCEGLCDRPLLYEGGWGKRLSYVVAAGRCGVVDVTPRYVLDAAASRSRRTLVPEGWLENFLAAASLRCRRGLGEDATREAEAAAEVERAELAALLGSGGEKGGSRAGGREALGLPGRTAGSSAWVSARGEDGGGWRGGAGRGGPEAGGPEGEAGVPAAATVTRYRRVGGDAPAPAGPPGGGAETPSDDSRGAPLRSGGACRSSSENPPGETSERLFDGIGGTKWLAFGGEKGGAWVERRTLSAEPASRLVSFDLVTADDAPERDPSVARVEVEVERGGGVGEEGAKEWVAVWRGSTDLPLRRGARVSRRLATPSPSSRAFRLVIERVRDPSSANSVQLAAWELRAVVEGAGGEGMGGGGRRGDRVDEGVAAALGTLALGRKGAPGSAHGQSPRPSPNASR